MRFVYISYSLCESIDHWTANFQRKKQAFMCINRNMKRQKKEIWQMENDVRFLSALHAFPVIKEEATTTEKFANKLTLRTTVIYEHLRRL